MFLTEADIATLTGRKLKKQQIEALRRMGIPFWINAAGKPIVATAAIEGGRTAAQPAEKPGWKPAVLQRAA